MRQRWLIGGILLALLLLAVPPPGAAAQTITPVSDAPSINLQPPAPPSDVWSWLTFQVDKVGRWFTMQIFGTIAGVFGLLSDTIGISVRQISGGSDGAVLVFSCTPTFGGANRNLSFCTPPDLFFGSAGFGPVLTRIWATLRPVIAMLIFLITLYRVSLVALATPRPPLVPELMQLTTTLVTVFALTQALMCHRAAGTHVRPRCIGPERCSAPGR